MRLSLIIPAYNEERYIGACLESVIHQTSPPDEVIVVENASTDRTAQIAAAFPVRVIREDRKGLIHARNRGFDEAKGDILARTDADAVLPARWIETLRRHFSDPAVDAVTGPVLFRGVLPSTTLYANVYLDFVRFLQGGDEALVGGNMALRHGMWRRVRERVCLEDRKVHEDLDLSMCIHAAGGRILRDKDLIVDVSDRRIVGNPLSFFGEYPLRFVETFAFNRKRLKEWGDL